MATPTQRGHGHYPPRDALPAIAQNDRRLGNKAPSTSEVFVRRTGNLATPRHRGDDQSRNNNPALAPRPPPHGNDGAHSHRSPYTKRLIHLAGAISDRSGLPNKLSGANDPFARFGSHQPLGPEEGVNESALPRMRQNVGVRSEESPRAPVSRVPVSRAGNTRGGLCNSGRGWDHSVADDAAAWAHKVIATPSPFLKHVQCERDTEILLEQQPPQGVLVCDHAGRVIHKFSQVSVAKSASEAGDCLAGEEESSVWDRHPPTHRCLLLPSDLAYLRPTCGPPQLCIRPSGFFVITRNHACSLSPSIPSTDALVVRTPPTIFPEMGVFAPLSPFFKKL